MSDNPDWVFYSDDRQTEADIMPRLVASFPGFRPRWERHLQLWNGEPAGGFNDIAEFVHFVVLRRLLPKRPWRTLVCLLRQPCPFSGGAALVSLGLLATTYIGDQEKLGHYFDLLVGL